MQLETKKLLEDVARALDLLERFARGKRIDDYRADPMLRSAVERQFEIVGEALKQLADRDPTVAQKIPDLRRIVGFRNILIHGYAQVDDDLVWDALTSRVASLRSAVGSLLGAPRKD
jgi:uncharacterized protein with HEPN domain